MEYPKCTEVMVKAKASDYGEEYDYCRNCKKELSEMEETVSDYLPVVVPGDITKGVISCIAKIKIPYRDTCWINPNSPGNCCPGSSYSHFFNRHRGGGYSQGLWLCADAVALKQLFLKVYRQI